MIWPCDGLCGMIRRNTVRNSIGIDTLNQDHGTVFFCLMNDKLNDLINLLRI